MSLQSRIEAEGIPYLSRDDWGADVDEWRWNNRTRSQPIEMALPVAEFFVHHSVTSVTPDPRRDMRVVESIGLNRFGRFSYSYAIHPPTGTILEGCGTWIGAHTYGRNSKALAAVAIGNFDRVEPPKQLLRSYGVLIRALMAEGHLTGDPLIRGHRDVRATGCPGERLYAAIPDIRGLAARPDPSPLPEDPMAYQLDIEAFVRSCYAEAGRKADTEGVNYWTLTAASSDDPKGVLNYMRGQLKLEPIS